jgi:hypothetical protein
MAVKPFLTTGIALASAAAIVAGTPTVLPAGATTVTTASAPAPTKLSSAQYELTALSDINLQGLINSYINGWGDYIGGQFAEGEFIAGDEIQTDPYFPGINPGIAGVDPTDPTVDGFFYNENGVFLSGVPGVLYYLSDNILPGNIDNYYFEAGGLPAAIYVAANEAFGAGSPPAVLAGLIFQTPPAALLASVVIGVTSLLPVVQLGPLTVGGGILANEYFAGGLPAVVNYIVNSFVNPPTAAATAAVKTKALTAAASDSKTVEAASEDTTTTTVADDTTTTTDDTTPTPKVAKVAKAKVNPLTKLVSDLTPTLKPGKPTGLVKDVADALSGKSSSSSTDAAAPSDSATKTDTKGGSTGSHAGHKAKAKSSSN